MELLSYFQRLLFDLGEAGCKRSAHQGVSGAAALDSRVQGATK
jgi:hypothetical protein